MCKTSAPVKTGKFQLTVRSAETHSSRARCNLGKARNSAQVYGVAVGDGEGDSSAAAFFFFGDGAGDSSVEVVVFFFVDVVLAAVDFLVPAAPFLVVEAAVVLVVVVAVSFLLAQETKNATAIRTISELRTDFFI